MATQRHERNFADDSGVIGVRLQADRTPFKHLTNRLAGGDDALRSRKAADARTDQLTHFGDDQRQPRYQPLGAALRLGAALGGPRDARAQTSGAVNPPSDCATRITFARFPMARTATSA